MEGKQTVYALFLPFLPLLPLFQTGIRTGSNLGYILRITFYAIRNTQYA